MQETIGNIVLDETYYPGEDLYSDGPIEDEMLEIARNLKEEEYNQMIAERKSWPLLYHFSHIRENIVEWLPITKEDSVLEIGAGCGAVTGALAKKAGSVTCIDLSRKRSQINAWRHKDYENIKILVGNFQDIEENLQEKYQYITLIGVFEYSEGYIGTREPYVEMLRRIEKHLAPGGKIIIAIENRLGMKYWAGCTEDHTGRFFEGLEGYPETVGVKTFSKKEITDIIRKAGNYSAAFYYPYPDYKFPLAVYSDDYLPKKGELTNNLCNYDRSRLLLFDEAKVYDSLTDNGLFGEFSNSFCIVLEKDKTENSLIYTKYSNERDRRFAIRTDILKQKDGSLKVKKSALYPEGKEHIDRLAGWYEIFSRQSSGELAFNRSIQEEDGVRLEYISAQTLEECLDIMLEQGEKQKAAQLLCSYLTLMKKLHSQQVFVKTERFTEVFGDVELPEGLLAAPITDIDMVCQNILMTKPPTIIDYEWTFDFPVPADFLIYRMIHYYADTHPKREYIRAQDLYQQMGISRKEKRTYRQMEERFQSYITGSHVPMREMYQDISPGWVRPEAAQKEYLQVYFSFRDGFKEKDSVKFPIVEKQVTIRIPVSEEMDYLRIDPGSQPCAVKIEELKFDVQDRETEFFCEKGCRQGEWLYIPKEDPNLTNIPVPAMASFLELSMEIHAVEEDFLKGLSENISRQQENAKYWEQKARKLKSQIQEMQNTKVWKLYQSYRRKVERKK